MAALNAWQKITRVVTGKPFGAGSDGAYSSATIPAMTVKSSSGASGQKNLTIAAGAFTNGDILLVHQSRGTGVGQWEVNKVASGGGTTTLVMTENLNYTYTDSGASQAQVLKIFQYTDVTVQSGTWAVTGWDGNINGILAFAANGTVTVTGSVNSNGDGFVLGAGVEAATGYQGEGTSGTGTQATAANGSGGGGGTSSEGGGQCSNGGGGGGNGAAGTSGVVSGGGGTAGVGGGTSGAADLTTLTLGGGGGGGGRGPGVSGNAGDGGDGGGAVFIFANVITVDGSIYTNGAAGGDGTDEGSGGGGGGGGSVLIQAKTATLGTNKITASAGGGGGSGFNGGDGGAGGAGRIAIHYGSSTSGTTNPTITETEDSTLVEASEGGGSFLLNFV